MKIEVSGKYEVVQTDGEVIPADILTIRAYGPYSVIARMIKNNAGTIQRFTSGGIAEPGYGFSHLQKRSKYRDWPIDAEVWVRDNECDEGLKRHFAGCEGNVPYAWSAGETSWTTDGSRTHWNFMELREKKDETNKGSC